jgi:hypothetical protein
MVSTNVEYLCELFSLELLEFDLINRVKMIGWAFKRVDFDHLRHHCPLII